MKVIHNIKPQETLISIARNYGTSVESIKILNNLNSNDLNNVKMLVIPNSQDDFAVIKNQGNEIMVAVTDNNIEDIKKAVKNFEVVSTTTIEDIEQGDKVLLVPKGKKTVHIVKPLETLKSISKLYSVSADYIIEKNKLKTSKLFVGQNLVL